MDKDTKISILGCGNIGKAIARGLISSGTIHPNNLILTRKSPASITKQIEKDSESDINCTISTDNIKAVTESRIIIIAVPPQSLNDLLDQIKNDLKPNHLLISVVSGAEIADIRKKLGNNAADVVRAMPNTAIAFRESMTCLSAADKSSSGLKVTKQIFDAVGSTLVVEEQQMVPATALCACGIAFFCRAIRAASQGGIEIGFHSEEAIKLAAQTAKGAATLLLQQGSHPEREVDKVTTPMGCTIAGLNQMEHSGFSSAFIKGIVTSAEKAAVLYKAKQQRQQQQEDANGSNKQ